MAKKITQEPGNRGRFVYGFRVILCMSAWWCAASDPLAVFLPPAGGFRLAQPTACLDEVDRDRIWRRLARNTTMFRQKGLSPSKRGGPQPLFIWPVVQNPLFNDLTFWAITNFVDHDANFPDMLLDYQGGARTYDTTGGYNHSGVDIFLWPFGWEMMDRDQAWVVAAADGTIVGKDDGFFDRNCTLPPPNPNWNAVYIEHADGSVAWYGHLKEGSLTSKPVGAMVSAGEYLGVVGSSGNSTGPHLHFEIFDALGNPNDPYQGPFNTTNPNSWWQDQPEYYLSAIVRLMTHDAPPSIDSFCPEDEHINRADEFQPGERLHTAVYYRDQRQGQVTQLSLLDPNGSTFAAWTHDIPEPHLAASFWYWFWDLPSDAPEGVWTFRATFESQTVSHFFVVGSCRAIFDTLIAAWPDSSVLAMIPLVGCVFATP